MMENLSKNSSLRTLGNKSDSVYWSKLSKDMPNFFKSKEKENQQSFEKSFHFHTAKGKKSKDQQNTLNRVTSMSNFSEKQSISRKPLDELLKSNKQSSFHGMKKSQRGQIKYETNNSQTLSQNAKDLASADKRVDELSGDKNTSNINAFQDCQSEYEKNTTFIGLEQKGRQVKTLQNEIHNSSSRSRSIKRKGLECTLNEKSLQKRIQESGIKSSIKLTTVKKKLQKTEGQSEIQNQVPKKDLKRVVLRRKTKESEGFTELESFNSINLNSTINKKCDESFQTIKITLKSLSKVEQNIRSLSKHKRTALNELNRSMSSIKQACLNFKFESTNKKSIQKKTKQPNSIHRHSTSKSKHPQPNQSSTTPTNNKQLIPQHIQLNLTKIHQKYKFITSYLSDIDIIGRLNSYDIAGKQQCKWVLLLIDQVYEMIKHSRETKLKGIDYTREYQYGSLHM